MEKTNEQEIREFFRTYPIPDIIPTNTTFTSPPKQEANVITNSKSPIESETKISPATGSRKRKRTDSNDGPMPRTVFSRHQLETLESRFREQSFLSKEERQELAEDLGLTERQVMIWFQNRRGRLKKRGPMDKAYNPAKLQEINIRRPYPFLCGVLTNGHRYQPGQSFSMYPREVQTHIQKVVTQLPTKEREQINNITDSKTSSDHEVINATSPQLQEGVVSKPKAITPPPNVSMYTTSDCTPNTTNSFTTTASQNNQYSYYNHQYTNSSMGYNYAQNVISEADTTSSSTQGSYYPIPSTSSVYMQGYNQSIPSNTYNYQNNYPVSCVANTSSNSCSVNSYSNSSYPLYDQQKTTCSNIPFSYNLQTACSSVPNTYNSLDWFKMYPRMCNRQTSEVDNIYQNYHPVSTLSSCYQVPTDYNSCSASY